MQYLLTALLLTLSMSISAAQTQEQSIRTKVICKEGYKFLLVWNASQWRPPSVVQIYKAGEGKARPPQPMKCQ